MGTLIIDGGKKLYGSVRVHGAKNSALPILAACVLTDGECVLEDCPALRDVEATGRILSRLGAEVRRDGDTLAVRAGDIVRQDIPDAQMREMRSSVTFLGALAARCGYAEVSRPGGCELGARPIDLHLAGLRALGAEITESGGRICCRAENMRGADVTLAFPSVGATENIMLAATAAKGRTRIFNPAREPEIVDLQDFLCALGADVRGAGGMTVEIEGGRPLHGARHRVIPDRIVAATYMAAVAAAGGAVLIENARPEQVSAVSAVLREAGADVCEQGSVIQVSAARRLAAVRPIKTQPYPGFPTDAQSIMMSVMATARGATMFVENIFESRYRHAGELMRMGADIRAEGRVALVQGVERLFGAEVHATDLRGGAGLVVAALGAEGRTRIGGTEHIERGYFGLEESLRSLGADISRE